MKSLHDQLQPLFARIAALVADEVMPLARQMAKDEILALISGAGAVVPVTIQMPGIASAKRAKAIERAELASLRRAAATAKPKLKAKATPSAASVKAARAAASVPYNKGGRIVCTVCREPGHNARRHREPSATASIATADAPPPARRDLPAPTAARPLSRFDAIEASAAKRKAAQR